MFTSWKTFVLEAKMCCKGKHVTSEGFTKLQEANVNGKKGPTFVRGALPEIGPKWEIFPSQGRGSVLGSNSDIIRLDFFLLSACEYSMPNHSGLLQTDQLENTHYLTSP